MGDFNCLTEMKAAFILLLALFCYFQSICEVSSSTFEAEFNNEVASIIKDDLAQQQGFESLERQKRGTKLINVAPKFRGLQQRKRSGQFRRNPNRLRKNNGKKNKKRGQKPIRRRKNNGKKNKKLKEFIQKLAGQKSKRRPRKNNGKRKKKQGS